MPGFTTVGDNGPRPRRPLPRPPSSPRTSTPIADQMSRVRAGISPVPFGAVDDLLFSPTRLTPTDSTLMSHLDASPAAPKWRGGDIVGTAMPRLIHLPPRTPAPGPSSPNDWRHWTDEPPSAGSTASGATIRGDARTRHSVPPRPATRPSLRGRNSAPPSRSGSPRPHSPPRERYSAPPPRAAPHPSPRRTRSTRRAPRPTAPAFRGEAALLEPLPHLRYPRLSRALEDAVRTRFPPLPPTPDVAAFDPCRLRRGRADASPAAYGRAWGAAAAAAPEPNGGAQPHICGRDGPARGGGGCGGRDGHGGVWGGQG
jgi:hypothetical protein